MTWTPEDAEIRRNALALFLAWQQAANAWREVAGDRDELPPEIEAELIEVDRAYWVKNKSLRDEHEAVRLAVMKKAKTDHPSSSELRMAMERAEDAYDNAPGDEILTDDNDNPILCAKSGVVIFETDEFIEDEKTGEHFLRAALGLPPRPVDEEDVGEAA